MSNKSYERMTFEERRRELLRAGCELFASRPYDEVWIDHVAEQAGVSRSLLYHYFGNKRGFMHAVVEHETAALFAATVPDPDLPPLDRLSSALDTYLEYVETHPHGYRAIFRGAPGSDSAVRAIVERNLERQEQRVLDALTYDRDAEDTVRFAVHGWLSFVIAVALDWLDAPIIDAHRLRDLCVDALAGILAAAGASVSGVST